MPKYVLKDIKKVDSNEKISLKSEKPSRPIIRKYITNLRDKDPKAILGKKKPQIDCLSSIKKQDDIFVPADNLNQAPFQINLLSFVTLGIITILLLNIFNVFSGGYSLSDQLTVSATTGYQEILAAANSTQTADFIQAYNSFEQAERNFDQALEAISLLKTNQEVIAIKENNIESVNAILSVGKSISSAGKKFSDISQNLKNLPELFIQSNTQLLSNTSTVLPTESLTDLLTAELSTLNQIIAELESAQQNLDKIKSPFIPSEYRETFNELQLKLKKLLAFLHQTQTEIPAILKLLGDRYPHRYLILLQNDTEARPTGGFIGSLMIIDINDGYITKADFHDVYKFDGQLHEPIDAPEDIAAITDYWRLRDSNYSPDFAISAEKAAWFLQKSKGPSVDTVIAINQSLINDLLSITGPLEVDSLKSPLTKENFQFILSYLIESKTYGVNSPKLILEKTINAFKSKLSSLENWEDLILVLTANIYRQNIMFYSRDDQVQAFFDNHHLTPHQITPGEKTDFLQVINTSIGGNKSDKYVYQNLEHSTYIDNSGGLSDELTITRSHRFNPAEIIVWDNILADFGLDQISENTQLIMGRGKNISNLKVYVPLGSELENVTGLAPDQVKVRHDAELQKTYFMLNLEVEPEQVVQVNLRYKLPFKLGLGPADIYRLWIQKQPGMVVSEVSKHIYPHPNLRIIEQNPSEEPLALPLEENLYQSAVISN